MSDETAIKLLLLAWAICLPIIVGLFVAAHVFGWK